MATIPDAAELVIAKVEAQRSATLIQVAAVLGAVVCIALAAALQSPINTQRKDLQLALQSNIYKELPPKYAWVSAMGGAGRGIAADILWARAEELKQDGKYYELHQLGKWICTLQPRFAAVWSFQAWNMSYNISVATHTAQERWQWVYNGIRLIRDEGIPNNERVVPLYHQMAWIWFHKVGDRMDDFHNAYKRVWAATMDILLGAPPGGVSNEEAIAWFKPVADAPQDLATLIAAHPGVALLVASLDALGIDVNAGTDSQRLYHPLEENFFHKYKAFQLAQFTAGIRSEKQVQSEQDQKLFAFFQNAPAADFEPLLAYLRAKVLREQYKMDPQFMLDLTGKLGTDKPIPIDWRTPWSQSLYWAFYGVMKGNEAKNIKEFDTLNTDRIQLFSLATLAKLGRYLFLVDLDEPLNSFLTTTPDLRYIEAMHKKYLELGKKHSDEGEQVGETAGETLRSGHVNNLHEAIVNLYLMGHVDEARKYLEYLAINYKDLYSKQIQEQYLQDVDTFVRAQLKDMADGFNTANTLIFSLLTKGYVSLAGGYGDEYSAAVRNAAMVFEIYQKDKETDPQGRRALPPFPQMRADTLAAFVMNPGYPLEYRAMVWNREQNEIKLRCYDLVSSALTQQCQKEGFDVKKAFPGPAGIEQWRKDHPKPDQVDDVAKKKAEEKRQAEQKK